MMEVVNGWKILSLNSRVRRQGCGQWRTTYNVECPRCKKVSVHEKAHLKRYKGCGDCANPTPNGSRVGDIPATFLSRIKATARHRNKKCNVDVTMQQLWDLFIKQGKRCALSGDDLHFPQSYRELSHGGGNVSLDRIDSDGHYTIDNVQWVTKTQQKMKMESSQADYIAECRKVAAIHSI